MKKSVCCNAKEIIMKQDIENIKKEFDEWYKNQKEMNPYIMKDWFLNKYSLIADEVLKVVVEKIEMLYGDIVTTKKDIAIPHNCIEYETALDDIINIINNLKS